MSTFAVHTFSLLRTACGPMWYEPAMQLSSSAPFYLARGCDHDATERLPGIAWHPATRTAFYEQNISVTMLANWHDE